MYPKHFFILLVTIVTSLNNIQSQDTFIPNHNELKIQAGISKISFRDPRISAQTKHSWAPTFGFNYNKVSDNSKQEFSLLYTFKSDFDSDRILDVTYHIPTISYSYERKVGEVFIGGFWETSTYLIFPRSRSGMFNNNPVSYSLFSTIGPKVSFDKQFGGDKDGKFGMSGSAQTSLLSYNVRPAYGHPYPEKFLESGVFTPTRRGMAGSLVRSGKIQTIDKHQSIQLKLGAYYHVSSSLKIGLDVRANYINNTTSYNSEIQSLEFLLGLSYIY